MEINKVYNIKIDILSPVHIGVDSSRWWKKGLDYIFDGDKVRLIDINRILKSGNVRIDQISALMANGNADDISDWIRNNLKDYSGQVLSSPIPHPKFEEIRTQIKNPLSGKPIIPGSSLKGAASSAIFSYLMNFSKPETTAANIQRWKNPRRHDGDSFQSRVEKNFGKIDDGSSVMRFIGFSDIEFESSFLINSKIYNLHHINNANKSFIGGWKHKRNTDSAFDNKGFNTVYEALAPGSTAYGHLYIRSGLFDAYTQNHPSNHRFKALIKEDLAEGLFKIINENTKGHLEKEIFFFKSYPEGKYSDIIIAQLESVLKKIKDDNTSCILKIAAGTGFHSITGDWMFDDYSIDFIDSGNRNRGQKDHKDSAKSRKIAIWNKMFSPMGFIEITLTSTLKQEERQKKLIIEEEKKMAKAKYEELIDKSNLLILKNEYENARELLLQAAELCPDMTKHTENLKEIESYLKAQVTLEDAKKRREQEQREREKKLEQGIEFLNERYDNGEYKVKDYKGLKNRINNWMKQSGSTSIPQNQYDILKSSVLRIYSATKPRDRKKDWSDAGSGVFKEIAAWTDSETANCIFQAIQETND